MHAPLAPSPVPRRDLLRGAGATVLAGAVTTTAARPVQAQTPKRGGVFRIAGFEPPNFDPHATPHWWCFVALSFTHSRLVRVKAGPGVTPGTLPVEGDLAESWTQPSDTTWGVKLRQGLPSHHKPPLHRHAPTTHSLHST